ncbi:MAG: efflux RND transporter periplasmic adaptor subunit [Solirubrobacterales bacterium]
MGGLHRSLRRMVALIAVIMLFSAAGCSGLENSLAKPVNTTVPGRDVKTAEVTVGNLVASISGFGYVKPTNSMSLYYTNLAGPLDKLLVKEGDTVKKGQAVTIIRPIDVSDQIADQRLTLNRWPIRMKQLNDSIQTAKANLDRAKSDLDNAKNWSPEGSEELRQAQARFDSASSQHRNAVWELQLAQVDYSRDKQTMRKLQNKLSQRVLRAPADGIVIFVETLSPNEMIPPGRLIAKIAVTKNLGFRMTTPNARYIEDIEQAAVVIGGQTYPVSLYQPNPGDLMDVKAEKSPSLIFMKFSAAQPDLEIDHRMAVQLKLAKPSVMMIPESAIREEVGKTLVDVLKDGRISSVQIERGIAANGMVEVISGLATGQKVVTGIR